MTRVTEVKEQFDRFLVEVNDRCQKGAKRFTKATFSVECWPGVFSDEAVIVGAKEVFEHEI